MQPKRFAYPTLPEIANYGVSGLFGNRNADPSTAVSRASEVDHQYVVRPESSRLDNIAKIIAPLDPRGLRKTGTRHGGLQALERESQE